MNDPDLEELVTLVNGFVYRGDRLDAITDAVRILRGNMDLATRLLGIARFVTERDEARLILAAARDDDDWDPGAMVMLYDQAIDRANRAEAELDRVTHELDKALAKIERMKWLQIYRPGADSTGPRGRCRTCSGWEHGHRMDCPHYEGPLTHQWHFVDVNGTFGGYDYQCSCGRRARIGGIAGAGELQPCPDAALDWRGEKPEAE